MQIAPNPNTIAPTTAILGANPIFAVPMVPPPNTNWRTARLASAHDLRRAPHARESSSRDERLCRVAYSLALPRNRRFAVDSLPDSFNRPPNQHGKHARGQCQHPPPVELSSQQRFVCDLYRRPAICQPYCCKPCPIHTKPFHYQVHVLLALGPFLAFFGKTFHNQLTWR